MFGFYMISMQIKYFPGSFTANTIALSSVDAIVPYCAGLLLRFYRARNLFVGFFGVQAILCILIVIFCKVNESSESGQGFLAMMIFVRAANCACQTLAYAAHPRIMPTLFAATSMGIANFVSSLVGVMAPAVAEVDFPFSILVFAIMAAGATASSYFIMD